MRAAAIALIVLLCASSAHAMSEVANYLGTTRGSMPNQSVVSDSVGSTTNETAVTGATARRVVVVGLTVSHAHNAACLIEFRNHTSTGAVLWSANVGIGATVTVTAPTGGYLFTTGWSADLNIKNSCGATAYYNLQYLSESGSTPSPTPTPTPTPSPTPTPTPTP